MPNEVPTSHTSKIHKYIHAQLHMAINHRRKSITRQLEIKGYSLLSRAQSPFAVLDLNLVDTPSTFEETSLTVDPTLHQVPSTKHSPYRVRTPHRNRRIILEYTIRSRR